MTPTADVAGPGTAVATDPVPDVAPGKLPWRCALVTGASAGIGESIALRLADEGVPALVLVARRTDRLEGLADRLRSTRGTAVEVLAADLAAAEGVAAVADRLASDDHPVDLLVNNAGLGTLGNFVDVDVDRFDHQMQVNVMAAMHLMHAALSAMVDRGHGSVMNMASLSAWQPLPGSAVYAAGKAFLLSLGESVHEELRGTGVTVTTVCPGFTRTEFADHLEPGVADALPSFAWMPVDQVAVASVDAAARGRAVCVPGLAYRAMATMSDPIPRGPKRWLMGRISESAELIRRLTDR